MSRFSLSALYLSGSIVTAALAASAPAALAQHSSSIAVALPAQPLGASVRELALRSGQTILVDADLVAGAKGPALRGAFTVEEALDRLLAGTGLVWTRLEGSIIIRKDRESGQDGDADADEAVRLLVTGSRIRGAPIPSPVMVLDNRSIRDSGLADLGDVARSLPQSFGGGQNPGVGFNVPSSTGGNVGGGSSVNLRGLGSDATLTVLNGRRVPYDSARQGVDISAIPLAAVDRIEVVADGASAIYGSDAVGGVVNVILRRDYDGVETRARIGGSPDGGNFQKQYGVLTGSRWNGGGGFLTYEYGRNTALMTNQRKYGRIRPDLTLLPASRRHAVAGSIHQDISDNLTIELDGLYNQRTGEFSYPTSAAANLSVSRITQSYDSYTLAFSGAARLSLGQWQLSLSGSFGKGRTYFRGDTFLNDQFLSRAFGRYNNQTISGEIAGDGPLFALPGGDTKLALGAGIRANDFAIFRGVGNINNARPSQDSVYAFGEASFPLVGPAQALPLMRSLSLSAALRYERYRGLADVVTPKFGMIYAPADFLDIKASWGRSFRAPSFIQLYSIEQAILYPITTFGGKSYPAGTTALLIAGGNSGLKPEKARSWSATMALHPSGIAGASFELSYFHTRYVDRIVNPIPTAALALVNPIYANQISYAPTSAQLASAIAHASEFLNGAGAPYDPAHVAAIINRANINAGRQTIRGIDAQLAYKADLADGKIELSANLTYLDSRQRLLADSPVEQLAGRLFNPPHWRGRGMISWSKGAFSTAATLSRIGGVKDVRSTPALKIDGMTTVDISTRYRSGEEAGLLHGVELGLSVQNILNALPSVVATSLYYDTPFDSTNYSAVGRFIALELVKKW